MGIVADKLVEKIKTHVLVSINFPPNIALHEESME